MVKLWSDVQFGPAVGETFAVGLLNDCPVFVEASYSVGPTLADAPHGAGVYFIYLLFLAADLSASVDWLRGNVSQMITFPLISLKSQVVHPKLKTARAPHVFRRPRYQPICLLRISHTGV